MGGKAKRMYNFANYIKEELGIKLPYGSKLVDLTEKSNRYSMYKVGPVLSINVITEMHQSAIYFIKNYIFFSMEWGYLQLAYYYTKYLN